MTKADHIAAVVDGLKAERDAWRFRHRLLAEQFRELKAKKNAEIDRLRALNAELREALKPFAAWITSRDAKHESTYPDDCALAYSPDRPNVGAATVGDLRKARAILAKSEAT
jgi:hypothetical protein